MKFFRPKNLTPSPSPFPTLQYAARSPRGWEGKGSKHVLRGENGFYISAFLAPFGAKNANDSFSPALGRGPGGGENFSSRKTIQPTGGC